MSFHTKTIPFTEKQAVATVKCTKHAHTHTYQEVSEIKRRKFLTRIRAQRQQLKINDAMRYKHSDFNHDIQCKMLKGRLRKRKIELIFKQSLQQQ